MTNLREAAQMALSGIEMIPLMKDVDSVINLMRTTQEALRAALAQPEQEPVAWMHTAATGDIYFRKKPHDKVFSPQPVYTAPPQREFIGLTDEDIRKLNEECVYVRGETDFILAIEAKLKEKNHA